MKWNPQPDAVKDTYSGVGGFLEEYGWYLLGGAVFLWWLLKSVLPAWQQRTKVPDESAYMANDEEMWSIRQRQQAKYEEEARQAAEAAAVEKARKKEEAAAKFREQKEARGGYALGGGGDQAESKVLGGQSGTATVTTAPADSGVASKAKKSSVLDKLEKIQKGKGPSAFNPLEGQGGSCTYRPGGFKKRGGG